MAGWSELFSDPLVLVFVLVLWIGWLASDLTPVGDAGRRRRIAAHFKGKHVWVTGASDGLGAAVAQTIASCCPTARLTLSARSRDRLEKVQRMCEAAGCRVHVVQCDVTKGYDVISASASQAEEEGFGPVDVLIANAGINHGGHPFTRMSPQSVSDVIGTNLTGAIYCVMAVLPNMVMRNAGQIVGISSQAANRGVPGGTVYGATKAGLSNFLESLRVELVTQAPGIVITAIHPGFIDTPAIRGLSHPKPLQVCAERAALLALEGVARQRAYWGYPSIMEHVVLNIARWAPAGVYAWVVGTTAPPR